MSQALIRSLLRKAPDGLTVRELMAATGNGQSYTLTALRKMPDTYIDRWTPVRHTHGLCGPWSRCPRTALRRLRHNP